MRKLRKVMALLLTLAMVMGMSLTAFAEDPNTASIKVSGLVQEETTVKIYKVVSWNEDESKWEIEQWAQGNDITTSNPYVNLTTDPVTIQWEKLRDEKISGQTPIKEGTTTNGTITFDSLAMGAYLIIAEGTTTEYSAMGTYTYKYENSLMVPDAKEVNAKGSDYQLTKKFVVEGQETETEFVNRGDQVKFNIKMIFPSFGTTDTNKQFSITDTPSGLNIEQVNVYVGEDLLTVNSDYTIDGTIPGPNAFTVNFTPTYIGGNTHAGESVRIEVIATVIDADNYTNKATSNKSNDTPEVKGETGSITIEKVSEKDQKPLVGAEFTIKRQGESNTLKFVKESEGVYNLAINGEEGEERVVTNSEGKVTVKGLDEGTYTITEVEAPDGYETTTVGEKTISVSAESGEDNAKHITFKLIDSKLNALPETGGIGTTIFTIGGCVIMIAAAGLYFASRRKHGEN